MGIEFLNNSCSKAATQSTSNPEDRAYLEILKAAATHTYGEGYLLQDGREDASKVCTAFEVGENESFITQLIMDPRVREQLPLFIKKLVRDDPQAIVYKRDITKKTEWRDGVEVQVPVRDMHSRAGERLLEQLAYLVGTDVKLGKIKTIGEANELLGLLKQDMAVILGKTEIIDQAYQTGFMGQPFTYRTKEDFPAWRKYRNLSSAVPGWKPAK